MASISPPPTKRRKLITEHATASKSSSTTTTPATATKEPLRIFSWNINGIQPFIQPSLDTYLRKPGTPDQDDPQSHVPNSLRNFLKRHDWPHVLNLQEVKIPLTDTATQRSVQTVVNSCRRSGLDDGPSYEVRFCLPRDKYNAIGFGKKVYGVASIIREDFYNEHVERVREVDWDKEGRLLVIETRSKLAIWNVYAVNGTDAPLKDSKTGKVIGTRHDRKLTFHRLLVNECKVLQDQGYGVIISGDLNVAREVIDGHPRLRTKPEQHVKNRKDFNEQFFTDPEGLQAIDTFRALHPDKKLYTWMSRTRPWMESCDRVDYILVTQNLGPSLQEADVLMNKVDRGPSDHFPIILQLDLPSSETILTDSRT